MGIVYVVEVGEYSDRKVIAVCSTEAHAKDVVSIEGDAEYSAWTLDDYQTVPPGHSVWQVTRDFRDDTFRTTTRIQGPYFIFTNWTDVIRPGTTFPHWSKVAARDADHAVKIVSEKWAMWKALQPPHPTPA